MRMRAALAALALSAPVVLAPSLSDASTIAGISITAIHANALTVNLKASLAALRGYGYYGGYYASYLYVGFGDGVSGTDNLTTESPGPPRIAVGVVTHTYVAPGTFRASVTQCCGNTTIFGGPGIDVTDTTTFTVCAAGDPDADGDGIADACDACPGTVAGAAVDAHGCSCAQKSCDDAIACTIDSCDASTAECTHVQDDASCNDGDPCTQDFCNPTSGCVHRGGECYRPENLGARLSRNAVSPSFMSAVAASRPK